MIYFESLIQVFNFGKFLGCDLGEVLMYAPDYIRWVTDNINGDRCAFSEEVISEIQVLFPSIALSPKLLERMKQRREEYFEFNYFKNTTLKEMLEAEKDDEIAKLQEEDTYERYNGSYAQDEMGYSDDDIDTIFDGDPSAYWNID